MPERAAVGIGQLMPATVDYVNDVLLHANLDPAVAQQEGVRAAQGMVGDRQRELPEVRRDLDGAETGQQWTRDQQHLHVGSGRRGRESRHHLARYRYGWRPE